MTSPLSLSSSPAGSGDAADVLLQSPGGPVVHVKWTSGQRSKLGVAILHFCSKQNAHRSNGSRWIRAPIVTCDCMTVLSRAIKTLSSIDLTQIILTNVQICGMLIILIICAIGLIKSRTISLCIETDHCSHFSQISIGSMCIFFDFNLGTRKCRSLLTMVISKIFSRKWNITKGDRL